MFGDWTWVTVNRNIADIYLISNVWKTWIESKSFFLSAVAWYFIAFSNSLDIFKTWDNAPI